MKDTMTTSEFRADLERTMSEADFQARVIELAAAFGWLSFHTFDSRHSTAGFPDLVLVRDRVLFVELKRANGILTPAQRTWGERLTAAGATFFVWRPADMTAVERELR